MNTDMGLSIDLSSFFHLQNHLSHLRKKFRWTHLCSDWNLFCFFLLVFCFVCLVFGCFFYSEPDNELRKQRSQLRIFLSICLLTILYSGSDNEFSGGDGNNSDSGSLTHSEGGSSYASLLSLTHGGLPELLISLGYSVVTGRLSVQVGKGELRVIVRQTDRKTDRVRQAGT